MLAFYSTLVSMALHNRHLTPSLRAFPTTIATFFDQNVLCFSERDFMTGGEPASIEIGISHLAHDSRTTERSADAKVASWKRAPAALVERSGNFRSTNKRNPSYPMIRSGSIWFEYSEHRTTCNKHLCAWGFIVGSEVFTESRLLLVEN